MVAGLRASILLAASALLLLPPAVVAQAVAAGSVPRAGAPLPPPGEMARLKAAIEAGDTAGARRRLLPLVEQHPEWGRATLLLATTYFRERRFELARPLFARAIELDPEEPFGRLALGWCHFYLGELAAAEAAMRAFLELAPEHAEGHYALGLVELERNEVAAARRSLERSAALAAESGDRVVEERARARLGDLDRRQSGPAGVHPVSGPGPGAGPASATGLRFTLLPDAAGIDLVMTSGRMPSREIAEVNGGGVALFDYDRDGDLDIFLANGSTLEATELGPGSRLYANRGNGTFEDATAKAGIDLRRWATGVAVGDYDGDGWDDLYVACFGRNVLLRNQADAASGRRFVDVTAQAGVGDPGWSTSAAFGDLDGDGDLDLYVVNYLEFDPQQPPARTGNAFKGVPVMAGPRGLRAQPDTLYENRGDGTFADSSAVAGARVDGGLDYGLVTLILDFDGDGRRDIFVGNDSTANQLYRNLGSLRFENVADRAGIAVSDHGVPQATMGFAVTDANGDGRPDLFNTAFSDDTNTLRINLGDGLFDDRSAQYGLAAVSRPFLSWGCGFYDFDLDGDEDLFVANGHVYPELDGPDLGASWAQEPLLFESRGGRFERASASASGAGEWLARRVHGRAVAFGDLDGDADVDIVMTTLNGSPWVLRNEAPRGRALAVELRAPAPNRHAFGSVVELETPSGVARRWITGGGSYQSVDEPVAFFALAGAARGTLRVRWPDGTTTVVEGVHGDQRLVVAKPPL
ncbi:MAG: VCBS repeat-containing protein [Thermoanaerobaculia bacterium]|nr:VCBS repeat-containing protein [Thermoanaerobaculia bacterium]